MNSESEYPESSSARFLQTVQPLRDLESNWTVDLAKSLEDYLLKICSGELSGNDDGLISVNFAEAALLLQGSVQVYSRKVEYLYSLVLHTLEFVSRRSQEDQAASTSTQQEATGSHTAKDEENDPFWGLDNIPVEAKSLLDNAVGRDVAPSHFVRPPANLIVLEGECLDSGGDAGELECYLLATNDLYRDFILLDSCDAVEVDNFLGCNVGKGQSNLYRGSSLTSKCRKNFQSPPIQSGGTGCKSSVGKKQAANVTLSPCNDQGYKSNECKMGFSPAYDIPGDDDGIRNGYSEPGDLDDSDDDDDPWKPLNPHEPGNLKVKPYKQVRTNRRLGIGSRKHLSVTAEFPLAKLRGPISAELTKIWEEKFGALETHGQSQPLSLYEKLRQSLVLGDRKTNEAFYNTEDHNEDDGYDSGDPDSGLPDIDVLDNNFKSEDVPPLEEKHNDGGYHCGANDTYNDPDGHANLEDLCRSHLDALLASLAETEKQTELASRVSTWKQRIEQSLEEQDARPPFDIHNYGERVLDKLSVEADGGNALSFGDVVRGQEKHDVARTFSALLQLVNNGDVDLVKSSSDNASICYSNMNNFHVRLLRHEKSGGALHLRSSKKRAKTPLLKGHAKIKSSKGKENCPSINIGKVSSLKCTPEGKKRRKSRIVAPFDMHFAC